ncbi:MAG: type II toxin-antitoxin system VapC family toxin [Clostridia bacterium]|nr:MAG: type II toxin-antitoxin system VapC family toxin [Clostridia bacterium]
MRPCYVLDACALIAFLNDEAGADVVEDLLRAAGAQQAILILHRINLLEVYYGVYRHEGHEAGTHVLEKVRDLPVAEVDQITEAVFMEAGRLKALYRLSLADSIAAAEAMVRSARLVTADHHEFDPIEPRGEFSLYWIR